MAEANLAPANDDSHDSVSVSDTTTESSGADAEASTSDGQRPGRSLLAVLRAPEKSDLARKRSVAQNLPHDGRRLKAPKRAHDPKGVTPAQRVREFPGECLSVSSNRLFCVACREEVALKLSIIRGHVGSSKHADGKARLQSKEAREKNIASSLQAYDDEVHARGETLPPEHRVYRDKVLMAFLRAGIPLNKMEHFRPVLESWWQKDDLRPNTICSPERKDTNQGGDPRAGCLCHFDGTTHLGEAMAIVLRFVDSDWKIQQRLVRLMLLAKSMSGEEVVRELIVVLSTGLGIGPATLLAAMRDRASVNGAAMRTVKVLYPNILDVGCFSHTIDNAGRHFNTLIVDEFIRNWLSLFSHSPKARLLWKARTGRSMRTYSSTRWWSKWEVLEQLIMFGDVKGFLDDNQDVGQATRTKLLGILDDPTKNAYLQIELAAIIDAGTPLVKATYNLEGDGPLVLQCHDQICTVLNATQTAHYPNVTAVADKLAAGNSTVSQQWKAYGANCVWGAQQYFTQKMTGELKDVVAAFKAAKLFSPQRVVEMCPAASDLDSVKVLPFLNTPL